MTTKSSIKKTGNISADAWFRQGQRVQYDPKTESITNEKTNSSVSVFERVIQQSNSKNTSPSSARWLTMLPGFPDGSYGWSKVDSLLETGAPRLYVEYVGQGDSNKPKNYKYSTMERADLVEAQWRAHNIQNTVVVTFDYSSLVLMELLQRQQDRKKSGVPVFTKIHHVMSINGGLFADGHTHPISTTPLLDTYMGRMGCWFAQRVPYVFDTMIKPLFSDDYQVTQQELDEIRNAIIRRKGARFMSLAAGFVKEHQRLYADRWNFETIFMENHDDTTFQLVGSEQDQFEWKQLVLAKERLGKYKDLKFHSIPGGHMSTSEQAETLAKWTDQLTKRA